MLGFVIYGIKIMINIARVRMPILRDGDNNCPACHRLLFKVTHRGIEIKCSKCKKIIEVINPKKSEAPLVLS